MVTAVLVRLGLVATCALAFTAAAHGAPSTPRPAAVQQSAGGSASFEIRNVSLTSSAPRPRVGKKPKPTPAPTTMPGMGVQFHCLWSGYTNADRGIVLDKLKAAGVRWVRIDAAWAGIEDTAKGARNQWYLGQLDYCVNEAGRRGIKVLVTLWWTPAWANGGAGRSAPPHSAQDYADFARWASGYFRGRVQAWEVWNEPDPSQSFWTGTTQQYVGLLKARLPRDQGRRPELARHPRRPLLERRRLDRAGLRLRCEGLVRRALDPSVPGARGRGPGDARRGRPLVVHAPAGRSQRDGHATATRTRRSGSRSSAGRLTPNWDGVENWNRGVTEAQQADYLVRAIAYARANYPYVTGMFWYKERAWATSATTGSGSTSRATASSAKTSPSAPRSPRCGSTSPARSPSGPFRGSRRAARRSASRA